METARWRWLYETSSLENSMKLWFGLVGAMMMIAFLASFVVKVKEPAMIAVTLMGVVMMVVDLWHARDETDT